MLFDYSNRFAVISYRINKFRWRSVLVLILHTKKRWIFLQGESIQKIVIRDQIC